MSILSFLQGIFGSKADRDNKAYRSYVESKINVLTDEFKALSDDELRARVADIRKAVHDAVADKEAEIKSIREEIEQTKMELRAPLWTKIDHIEADIKKILDQELERFLPEVFAAVREAACLLAFS